jgi:hypothetical protein
MGRKKKSFFESKEIDKIEKNKNINDLKEKILIFFSTPTLIWGKKYHGYYEVIQNDRLLTVAKGKYQIKG